LIFFFCFQRYLILLQNQKDFPCLSDQNGCVISVPPLTNAERSKIFFGKNSFFNKKFLSLKISSTSESIFIEITSESSMNICHSVMDSFLRQMVQLQLGQKSNDPNIRQILKLQQIRVIDEEGKLPRSKNTGRFRQESTRNRWNMEAVFPPENFRIFSDEIRPIPAEKLRELTGIHRKKIR
jgi:hypothetical protein